MPHLAYLLNTYLPVKVFHYYCYTKFRANSEA